MIEQWRQIANDTADRRHRQTFFGLNALVGVAIGLITCMMPGCDIPERKIRGLCQRCYQATARMVRNQETTWEKLEAEGLVLPSAPGRPRTPAHQAIVNLSNQQASDTAQPQLESDAQ